LIPNLLTYAGPVIAVDPKGELYHVTAERRRRMGQHVVRVDPFRIAGDDTDALNPLDVIDLPRADLECDSHWLATLLATGQRGSAEPFWDEAGTALNFGVLTHLATADGERRSLNTLRRMLHADDSVYDLSVLLDTCRGMNEAARQEIASFLHMPDVTRGGVQAVAASFLKPLASRKVADSLGASSFPLSDVVAGRPLSVYLIVPPDKLESHKALLKLWLGTLLKAVCGAQTRRPCFWSTSPPVWATSRCSKRR
jgi:type IV secretion system protein VirD4